MRGKVRRAWKRTRLTRRDVRRLHSMRRRGGFDPTLSARAALTPQEVYGAGAGPVNVTGPEQSHPSVLENRRSRDALEGHEDSAVALEFEARGAFQFPVGRGRLVKLDGVLPWNAELHGSSPGLEHRLARRVGSVEDQLEVQPRVRRHEDVASAALVLQ